MIRKRRRFDCVAMKNKLQAEFLREHRGLTPAQSRAHLRRQLATSDAPAARFWRRITATQPVSKVAESQAPYGKKRK
jgi:hypothetical protein